MVGQLCAILVPRPGHPSSDDGPAGAFLVACGSASTRKRKMAEPVTLEIFTDYV